MSDSFVASILVIEDDPQQIKLYSQALAGYRLTCITTGTAALQVLEQDVPDLILLDNVLEKGEIGTKFLPRLKQLVETGQLSALQGPDTAHYVMKKPVHLAK